MAELGTIDFQNLEAGAVRPSSGEDLLRGIGQTLDAVGEIHRQDVLGDFREEASQLLGEQRQAAMTSTIEGNDSQLEGEPGRIQRRARLLKDQIEMGNSSQKALAELELNRLFNKHAENHQGLINDLRQEFGIINAHNQDLIDIGFVDQINEQNAKMAAEDYKAMIDFARDRENGLGIDPSIPPTSAEFAKQYAERSAIRDLEQQNQFNVLFASTVADMEVGERMVIAEKALMGKGNLLNSVVNRNRDLIVEYRNEVAKGDRADFEKIERFQTVIRPQMLTELNDLKSDLVAMGPGIFPGVESRATPQYAKFQTVIDDQIKRVDFLIDAVSGDDPTAMDLATSAFQINGVEMRQGNQAYDNFATFWGVDAREGAGKLFTDIAKFDVTGANVLTGNAIAGTGLNLINNMIGSTPSDMFAAVFTAGGQGRIIDTTPASQHKDILQGNWSGTEGFYGVANSSEEDDIRRSVAHLELLRQAANNEATNSVPGTVGPFLTDATNAFLVMTAIGNPSKDQIDKTNEIIADRAIFEAALAGGNSQNLNRRLALADAASDFYSKQEPARIMNDLKTNMNQTILGRPLLDFVSIRPSKEDVDAETELTFEVRRDFVRAQADTFLGGGVGAGQVDAYARRIQNTFAPIMVKVNNHIRANAHIEALGLPTIAPESADYINMADRLGWLDYLVR